MTRSVIGLAKVCKCEHYATDHVLLYKNSLRPENVRTACNWDGCQCKKFEFDHYLDSRGRVVTLE